MDKAGGAVDRNIEIPLTALAVAGAQLGQVLHVQMHKAEIIGLERTIRLTRPAWPRQAAQALGFQDAVDRVAVEVGQEVGDYKGEVIQRKAGCATQRTDNGALFFRCFPGQLVRAARVVLAIGCTALPPLADRLGGHAIALGQYTGGLARAGDLGPDRRGGAGISMDRVHHDLSRPPRPRGPDTSLKAPGVCLNRPTHPIPTMFRYQAPRACYGLSQSRAAARQRT